MDYYTGERGYPIALFSGSFVSFEDNDYKNVIIKMYNKNKEQFKIIGKMNLKQAVQKYPNKEVTLAYKRDKELIIVLEEN